MARSFLGIPALQSQQNTTVYNQAPSLLQQQHQARQQQQHQQRHQQRQQRSHHQQYIEEYPFSPTTPQDLQLLSVTNFSSHSGFEYEDFGQGFQHMQPGAVVSGEDVIVQDMNGMEQERDPLLSMLAEMAERDGGFPCGAPSVEEQRVDNTGWMGEGGGGGGGGGGTGGMVVVGGDGD